MLDKFDEQLEMFHKENVFHANDHIVCRYMLNPASQKPDELKRWIQDSKVLQKVNMDVPILRYPSINSVINQQYFMVKELIKIMQSLVTSPKT